MDKPQIQPMTQIERIISYMMLHPEKVWWVAQDFMPPAILKTSPYHVGYEATARLSEMVERYNLEGHAEVFAVERQGRYRVVRFRWDNFEEALKRFPAIFFLAERTDIMRRFAGLAERVAEYKPAPPPEKKPKFKSYAL